MRKIRIGVLGCADIAKRLLVPNILQTGLFDLVAVASRSEMKAMEFANKFQCDSIIGYEKLLERNDIQAVYIPLPTGLHFEWITKALNSGKHVLAEKSLACDFAETSSIISLAKEKKLCVFENFMFVFHSQFDFVKTQIEQSTIGEIRLLRASFGFPPFNVATNIRYKKELAGGALLDAGAYTIMAAHFLLGQNQKVLAASLEKKNWDVDYQGSAMLKNEAGIVSHLSFGFDNFYQNNIELWGSKGKMTIERAFTASPDFSPKVIIETQNIKSEYSLAADNHFQKILNKFAECIVSDQHEYLFDQILCQSKLLSQIRSITE
jgi:NDP-hexose-3-ketoreductase